MMDNEYKQHHGANNRPANNIVEEEEIIRPSIPSIIPLKNHNDIRNTSSLPNEGDDSSGCSISSLISEVTLMTFSEEKATMLKSEFLSRMQQESHTRPLSRDEKMALLTEIQADQDKKFKLEMQRQETKRSIKREGERTRHEFFDRLNALRVDIGREDVQLQHQQKEDDQSNISEIEPSSYRSGGGGVISSDNGTEHEEKQKGQQISCRRASMRRRYERRISGLSSSDITEKRCNSSRSLLSNSYGHKGDHMATEGEEVASATLDSDLESKSSIGSVHSNATNRAGIEELIELKMEIANQQATIDTITAQLHNFEINNAKLLSSLSRENTARRAAEKSNEELTEQLRQCREREVELRREAMASSVTRPAMMKQSSTLDWGDADESDRSILDRLKKLEEENEKLHMENARLLQRQERSDSVHTDCTENLTRSLDSSEYKTSQPQPSRRQARSDLGASLLTLGSSIKLPFTKMVRSGSELSVRATFEEETLTARSPSTGTLPTATSDAERNDNNNPREGTLQAHVKAQRRWSSGDGWRQKMSEENARSDSRRRWGSYHEEDYDEEDNEEGRGIGGWLNGWKVFGKVDEELDGEGANGAKMKV